VSFSHTNRFTVLGTNPHQDGDERIDDNPYHLLANSDNSIQHGLTTSDTTVPTAAATNTTSNCNSSDVVLNGGSNSSPQQHNGGADNNSTQNTANGFTFTISSALPSTLNTLRGARLVQQKKIYADSTLKTMCHLPHTARIAIVDVEFRVITSNSHLLTVYLGDAAEYTRIKQLLDSHTASYTYARGRLVRGSMGPIQQFVCTAEVAAQLHTHCNHINVKMDADGRYAKFEWIHFVAPEADLAAIFSVARYAISLGLGLDSRFKSLVVKKEQGKRRHCERCLSITHWTGAPQCQSTDIKCRNCLGNHSIAQCSDPSRRHCALCDQDDKLKPHANAHTYSTCKQFHGSEYTLVDMVWYSPVMSKFMQLINAWLE
jgi:hypothetical protein